MIGGKPDLAGYTGGWCMPVICTGRGKHPEVVLSHVYEHERSGVAYSAPPQTVMQTRQLAAINLPGHSRESIRFMCPTCSARPTVTRERWGKITRACAASLLPSFNVSALD